MEIRTVGVVGGGQMGNGIAHVAAAAGCGVVLADLEERLLAKARDTIEKNLDREVSKGQRTAEEKRAALDRLSTTTDLSKLAAADLVIEAVVENETVKQRPLRPARRPLSGRRPSSPRTRPRSRSRAWRPRPGAPTGSSACTS